MKLHKFNKIKSSEINRDYSSFGATSEEKLWKYFGPHPWEASANNFIFSLSACRVFLISIFLATPLQKLKLEKITLRRLSAIPAAMLINLFQVPIDKLKFSLTWHNQGKNYDNSWRKRELFFLRQQTERIFLHNHKPVKKALAIKITK